MTPTEIIARERERARAALTLQHGSETIEFTGYWGYWPRRVFRALLEAQIEALNEVLLESGKLCEAWAEDMRSWGVRAVVLELRKRIAALEQAAKEFAP